MINKRVRSEFIIYLFLVLSILAAYWNVQYADFVNLDDPIYVIRNHYVKAGLTIKGVVWAFLNIDQITANWHPLTWLSYMIDYDLYGFNAGGFHITNLYFHIANSILLLICFRQMTGSLWRSTFVAALFALHPLHVESVAWISERKDVLSTFFWILTMILYVHYVHKQIISRYLALCLSFLLGLMAKPMLVTLPFVLLLLDFWPLKRITNAHLDGNEQELRMKIFPVIYKFLQYVKIELPFSSNIRTIAFLIYEKVPLFLLSAISCFITLYAQQRGGAVPSFEALPLFTRFANVCISYIRYLGKTIWPQKLTAFYPYPSAWPLWQVALSILFILIVTYIFIKAHRRRPYLAFGWFWFLGTMVPVIGIVQIGSQSMADRYTYIPLIGLFVIAAWGLRDFARSVSFGKKLFIAIAGSVIVTCMVLTTIQVKTWQDDKLLYEHMIMATKNNYFGYHGLGVMYLSRLEPDKAIYFLKKVIEIKPSHSEAHHNLGFAYLHLKNYNTSISHFKKALRYEYLPENLAMNHNYLGVAYVCLLRTDEAIMEFKAALQINPDFTRARVNLINTYELQKRVKESKNK